VMDMSFANQFLSMCYLARHGQGLAKDVHDIPGGQDDEVAMLKLSSMGISIDELTDEQLAYLNDYSAGT